MNLRDLGRDDAAEVLDLYMAASAAGTLGRDPDEYDLDATAGMVERYAREGFCIGAFEDGELVGEIHASRLQARRFSHVFSGLTIAVRPDRQGRGVGRRLFEALLARIDALDPPVLRVELMLQAGNPAAFELYRSLGFVDEGRLRGRVRTPDGDLLDDIYMGRLRAPDA